MIVLPRWLTGQAYDEFLSNRRLPAWLRCPRCHAKVHGHGRIRCKAFGSVALRVRRVKCTGCGHAPTARPAFSATELHTDEVTVEQGVARYVGEARATYRGVARALEVAASTVHRWVTLIGLAGPGRILALLVRLRPAHNPVLQLPKVVPGAHRKARTPARRVLLLRALQGLSAGRLCAETLYTAQPEPLPAVGVLLRPPIPP